jgi:hypothetical protein
MSSYTLPTSSLRALIQSLYLHVLSNSSAYYLFNLATLSVMPLLPYVYIYIFIGIFILTFLF